MSDELDRARREYYRTRVDNLRSQVPMVRVLEDLGIRVHVNENVEIQYPCPLHGDGKDQGFSARVYPGDADDPGGHTFCWGCQKARDQVQWVRDYLGLSFMGAVKHLEEQFEVTGIPNIYDYFDPSKAEEGAADRTPKFLQEIEDILEGGHRSREFDVGYLERKIDRLVSDRRSDLTRASVTRLYYVYDLLSYDLERKRVTEDEARVMAQKLEDKINSLGE